MNSVSKTTEMKTKKAVTGAVIAFFSPVLTVASFRPLPKYSYPVMPAKPEGIAYCRPNLH